MDFAHWVYKNEGASVVGLNHLADSAYTYGKRHGTWRHIPFVGDLALWNGGGHVGIVVAVNRTNHTTEVVSGNSWNPARRDYTAIWRSWYSVGNFEGFAGSVAA